MKPLVASAAVAAVMAAVAVYLAATLSPWALLAWPAAAVLFGLFVAIESREHRARVGDQMPPCAGCSSPLCPDCRPEVAP